MIKIPESLWQILESKPQLAGAVRTTLDLFEPWLEQSGMPFFPGFTDHSPRHINDVLQTAASMISDTAHPLISAEDVAVLCLAVLLHDCGMHLTQDGFRALVEREPSSPLIPELDQLDWPRLWADFRGEAQRFGQEKLVAIFGSPDPIRIEEINLNDLSEQDCLLIGEFVRRHHARLAHEVAISGVPIRSSSVLNLVDVEDDIRDLAGLVARSHGLSIRQTFQYIESKYGLIPEYRHIKTPFLMAVLRIADYVQVKSERAIRSLLSVKELRSPVSRQEWRAHFAVKDVSTRHDDPEALYVHAYPKDVHIFLKLEALFKDIQRELDESWATIGEVYGRHADLVGLGLTVRRIRSNLEQRDKFAATVTYIPINAGFISSGTDLLKLLVGPLYNYDPKVGIRELLQNAIDACRERHDLAPAKFQALPESEFRVVLQVHEMEDGTGWLTVTDDGVGMTLDTIINYFLVAGASFRNSELWKHQHIDDFGKSRILRGGRFGVGVLASFLLGEEIEVRTRHFASPEHTGIEFRARIDDRTVELRRTVAPAGTSIRVHIADPNVINTLRPSLRNSDTKKIITLHRWDEVDWFAQLSPHVEYQWIGYRESISESNQTRNKAQATFTPQSGLVPNSVESLGNWHRLEDFMPYRAIFWRYSESNQENDQTQQSGENDVEHFPGPEEASVNGIRVQRYSYYGYIKRIRVTQELTGDGPSFEIERPSLAIFDHSGACPINLQRNAIAFDRLGIDDILAKSVLQQQLASFALRKNFKSFGEAVRYFDGHPGISFRGFISPLCMSSNGVLLATREFISNLGIRRIYFVTGDMDEELTRLAVRALNLDEAIMLRTTHSGAQADLAWFRGLFAGDDYDRYYAKNVGLPAVAHSAVGVIMQKQAWAMAKETGKVAKFILAPLSKDDINEKHTFVFIRSSMTDNLRKRLFELFTTLNGLSEIGFWELSTDKPAPNIKTLLSELWNDTFHSPLASFGWNVDKKS